MVSGAHRQWPRRHPQDHDRGAGPQASDRAVALCDDGRAARRRRAEGEGDLIMAATMIPAATRGVRSEWHRARRRHGWPSNADRVAASVRRPSLTASARDVTGPRQVGTEKRPSGRTKKLDQRIEKYLGNTQRS